MKNRRLLTLWGKEMNCNCKGKSIGYIVIGLLVSTKWAPIRQTGAHQLRKRQTQNADDEESFITAHLRVQRLHCTLGDDVMVLFSPLLTSTFSSTHISLHILNSFPSSRIYPNPDC